MDPKLPYHNNTKLALREIRELDLLHCNGLAGIPIQRTVYRPKRTLSQAVAQLLECPRLAFAQPHI